LKIKVNLSLYLKCLFNQFKITIYGLSKNNKGTLDEFPFLDDGTLVWDAMYEYVGEYISHYYSSNEDVINDNEIRDWIREIEENGHPNHKSEFIEMKLWLICKSL
jgi:hypothetical protein